MGRAKEEWMRQIELEPMYEWIEESYGDDVGEEGSETWNEAVKSYEEHCEMLRRQEEEDWYLEEELDWYKNTDSQIDKYETQIGSVLELLDVQASDTANFSLLVMLHGHVVASVESYLASTFIHKVTGSEELIRKLVETDPEFSKRKFTLKEIYDKHENLQIIVAKYLKDLIFHDLAKVKPMYRDVLGCDFGDISWLIIAVRIRHHCVHRAGLDKDENKVELSRESIKALVGSASSLVINVEASVNDVTESGWGLNA